MWKIKRAKYLGLFLAAFFIAGVCTHFLFIQKSFSQLSVLSLKERYRSAIQDAALVEPNKIVNNLISVSQDNNLIVWNENKTKVLVVTWKSKSTYENYIMPYNNASEKEDRLIWVTVAPQLKDFCHEYLKNNPQSTEEELKLRLKQYLGLDPDWKYDVFVEMWVSPQDMFRPCTNPDITERGCKTDFEAVTPKVVGITNGSGIKDYQLFYQNLYFKSIRSGTQPWTGLGYTYDWGSSDSHHVGASEFILVPGAAYTIKQAIPTMNYCHSSVP